MNVIKTGVLDVYIIEPQVFGDKRGWFMESWSQRKMEEAGLFYNFVQDNQSFSSVKGTTFHFPAPSISKVVLRLLYFPP